MNDEAFSEGDDVYFISGITCTLASGSDDEKLTVDWEGNSGDSVIIGCYWDDGGSPNHDCSGRTYPVFYGANTYPDSAEEAVILKDYGSSSCASGDCGYLTIQQLEISCSGGRGVKIVGPNNTDHMRNIIIDDCHIHQNDNAGIQLGRVHGTSVDLSKISGCTISDAPSGVVPLPAAVSISGADDADTTYNLTISGNILRNNSAEGITIMRKTRDVIVEHNVFYSNNYLMIYLDNASGVTIRRNLIYNDSALAGSGSGIGISTESWHDYCVTGNHVVYGNLFAGLDKGIYFGDGNACDPIGIEIFNNTFVDCDESIRIWNDYSAVTLYNNISWMPEAGGSHVVGCNTSGFTWGYNLWDSDPGNGACDDTNDPTWASADLSKALGWRDLGEGELVGTEFAPNSGSPAVGAGDAISGVTYDAGLDPYNVDFTASPISAVTALHSQHGWSIGAIVSGDSPYNVSPVDDAISVSVSAIVDWDFSKNVGHYDFYFGETGSVVQVYSGVSTTSSYDPPGNMSEATEHQFYFDIGLSGVTERTKTWSFTTSGSPPPPAVEGLGGVVGYSQGGGTVGHSKQGGVVR